jgi:hypothetical protein
MSFGLKSVALAAALLGVLAGCGGGGASTPSAPTLSETQRLFEETALASNGGAFSFNLNWSWNSSGTGPTATWVVQPSGLNMARFELAKSPLGEANGSVSTYYPAIDVIASLPTPANRDEALDTVGDAFIDNGQIKFAAGKEPSTYSYIGNDVVSQRTAKTGEVASKFKTTGYTKVALAGKIIDAPEELRKIFAPVASYTSTTATFLPGAAYYQRVSTRMGDHLFISDGDFNPDTNPQSATEVFTGSIEAFAAAQPNSLVLSKGSIKTIKGARCWVNSTSAASNGALSGTVFSSVLPSFGAYCEVAGKVYSANLQPDGASMGQNYPNTGASTATPAILRLAHQLRYNEAAAESLFTGIN